jgi:UDP-glucose 4-epimerase
MIQGSVKNTILVTGGSGYLGTRICNYLADKNINVIPICNSFVPNDEMWSRKMYDIIIGDIANKSTLKRINQHKLDYIIHLISLDQFSSQRNIKKTVDVNVKSTWDLLELAKEIGVKTVINFSTVQVYGRLVKGLINEQYNCKPINFYGLSHLMSESVCNYYHTNSKVNVVNIRLSNSYGLPVIKNDKCWSLVLNEFCKSAYYNKEIKLNSDGSPLRDFIHGSEVVETISNLLENYDKKDYKTNIFNLASGKTYSILELAFIVKDVIWHELKVSVDIYVKDKKIEKLNKPDRDKYVFDVKKINNFKSKQSVPLSEGISEVLRYLVAKN